MTIKITDKILSISPYISTNWSRIAALHMKGNVLAITLVDGDTLHIPNLDSETIHLIFQHHAVYLEKEQSHSTSPDTSPLKDIAEQGEHSVRLAFGSSLDGLGSLMQHDPLQTNAPDLPPEILQKIGAISKIIAPNEELLLPKAEPGCNCFHCQITRALNPEETSIVIHEEPQISNEELKFEPWIITQTDEKLYSVVNRLDEHEKYLVYLGQPIGCTCGGSGCEHILAVLKS